MYILYRDLGKGFIQMEDMDNASQKEVRASEDGIDPTHTAVIRKDSWIFVLKDNIGDTRFCKENCAQKA